MQHTEIETLWNEMNHTLNEKQKRQYAATLAKSLIDSTTSAGLRVVCQRDDTVYMVAQIASDEEFKRIPLLCVAPFENWNYILTSESFSQVII